MAQVTDNFDREDQSGLGTNGAGSSWTACKGVGLDIITNKASTASSTSTRGNYQTGTSQTNDQYAQAVIGGKDVGSYFTILLRGAGADGSRNCYKITVGGTNEYYIEKDTAGTNSTLVSGTTTFANGDTLRGEVEGTTIRLKVNGATVDTTTDSAHASGSTGIEGYWENTTVTLDNFEAGDLGGSSILKQMLMNH